MNRQEQIKELREGGMTLIEIGKKFDLSKERVRQICNQYDIEKPQKIKEKNTLQKKKDSFPLSEKLFNICSRKYIEKKRNNRNGKRAGWEFEIEFQDIPWVTKCPILGIKLDYNGKGTFYDNTASFDRIDTTKGYIKGNVAIISWKANKMKASGSAKDHRNIADWIDKNTK